jgi:predicted DNA-binding transcriptional regulator AlpA
MNVVNRARSKTSRADAAKSAKNPSVYLTSAEAAELLGISEQTLRAWRSKGAAYGPPFKRIHRSIRYHRGELLAWMGN